MSQFNIDEIEKRTLSGLKDFQRATEIGRAHV